MEIVILWIGLSILVGVFAVVRRNRSFGWFFLSLIISPLFAGILVAILEPSKLAPIDGKPKSERPPAFGIRRRTKPPVKVPVPLVPAALMIGVLVAFLAFLLYGIVSAHAQQTTFYGKDGRVTGRAATDSQGTTTYYDARGSVTGKATEPHRNTAPFSIGDPVDGILVEKPTRGKQ
jgi:YD repeat-containing protein